MSELYAQGDILFERVSRIEPETNAFTSHASGTTVIAEGELTGHRHTVGEGATLFRDDALARDIPSSLYIGHLTVGRGGAVIEHQEHAGLPLGEGTYRVRRQRELQPQDSSPVLD